MSNRGRHAWASVISGSAASALLFYLSYATSSTLLFWPQYVGMVVCMALRGVHSATETDYAMIAIPINAVIYATGIFAMLRVFARRRRSQL
jgi:hypothetical protein